MFRNALYLGIWFLALWLSLKCHRFSGWMGHSVCGPWGCAAAPEALLGYHLFWMLLLCPIAAVAQQLLPPHLTRWLSGSLMACGLLSLLSLLAWSGWGWHQSGGDPRYLLQRMLFIMLTSVDIPAVELTVAGLVARWLGRSRRVPLPT